MGSKRKGLWSRQVELSLMSLRGESSKILLAMVGCGGKKKKRETGTKDTYVNRDKASKTFSF
jgi:hypothetical protein